MSSEIDDIERTWQDTQEDALAVASALAYLSGDKARIEQERRCLKPGVPEGWFIARLESMYARLMAESAGQGERTARTLHYRLKRYAESAGFQIADRGADFTLLATFERTGGDTYSLQWALKAGEFGPVRVRKLLDDQWHTAPRDTLQGALEAIEAAELADTRAAWPEQPEYWTERLVRPVSEVQP